MGNNKVLIKFSRAVFTNAIHFTPAAKSILIDKGVKEFSFRQTDINGRAKYGRAFDLGAVEYWPESSSSKKSPSKKGK